MTAAVEFRGVSKIYRRGYAPSLREDLAVAFSSIAGRRRSRAEVHALSEVDFKIEAGTSFAIMGLNGSGKTTALKLMSRVTYPTSGKISVRGRVGALIEVGTGLHPELTGRENIWLYGRILGLKGRDIAQRFDSIVDFAAIGAALDQPVKQFSSGMHVRLGFALASHLEPDILLVDESLSVGDVLFQRRCLEYMHSLHDAGVTVIFVSHVPSLVTSICTSGLMLDQGRVVARGSAEDIADRYISEGADPLRTQPSSDLIRVVGWGYEWVRTEAARTLRLSIAMDGPSLSDPCFAIAIASGAQGPLAGCYMLDDDFSVGRLPGGPFTLTCQLLDLPLSPGHYDLWLSATDRTGQRVLLATRTLGFVRVPQSDGRKARIGLHNTFIQPKLHIPYRWAVEAGDVSGLQTANMDAITGDL